MIEKPAMGNERTAKRWWMVGEMMAREGWGIGMQPAGNWLVSASRALTHVIQ